MDEQEKQIEELTRSIVSFVTQNYGSDADIIIRYKRNKPNDKKVLSEELIQTILTTYRDVIIVRAFKEIEDRDIFLRPQDRIMVEYEADVYTQFDTDKNIDDSAYTINLLIRVLTLHYEKKLSIVGKKAEINITLPLISVVYSRKLNEAGSKIVDKIFEMIESKTAN